MFTKSLLGGTVHDKLPTDMRKALAGDKKLTALWQDITPLARNEWICWVTTCAKQETRDKHVLVMKDKMYKGMRRPCCWVGCIHRTDKATSPSVRGVLAKK